MQTHDFDGYTVTLQATNKRDSYNHIMVEYSLVNPKGETIFSGQDLGASPLHAPESYDSAIALLSFLTLQPGDVEEEYFQNYTSAQVEFRDSTDCENLSLIVYDYENERIVAE